MDQPIISVSGLRGIVGTSLTPPIAIDHVTAFARTLDSPGPIVVTRDGRASGPMLAHAVACGLQAVGRDVLYGDVAATPTTGILVRQQGAAGGIQISASHNPPAYNGLKLFGADGRVLSADAGKPILEIYRAGGDPDWVAAESVGGFRELDDTTDVHLEKVLATVNAEAIRARRFRVVLDSNRGAGSVLGRRLLESLGCQLTLLGDLPDGQFEHLPEPTESNLESVARLARNCETDVVFCQDPDADRLAVIDERGTYIGEEYTLALVARHVLPRSPGVFVMNCATSQMTADVARQAGCDVVLTAVGEANVADGMILHQATLGGEGNGGPIDPRVGYVRDSFVGMAQILDAMAATGQTISQLAAQMPRYEIRKLTASIAADQVSVLFERLEDRFSDAMVDRRDGLRLQWEDRWLLVRPSNTEPIVRVIAEARSGKEAMELCNQAIHLVETIKRH